MNSTRLLLLSSNPSPVRFFGPSDIGAVIDPSDMSSMYQDSTGITPANVGQTIGLALDKSLGASRSSDYVVNGTFAADVSWSKASTATIASGQLTLTASTTNVGVTQTSGTASVANRVYEVSYEVISNTLNAGALRIGGASLTGASFFGATATVLDSTVGMHSLRLPLTPAGAGTVLDFYITSSSTSGALVLDNFSVRLVAGNHAVQTTAGSRPTLNTGGKINYSSGAKFLVLNFPSSLGSSCTVGRSIPRSDASILTAQTITTSFTDTTDNCGLVIINRALTATETNQLRRWLNRRAG